MTLYGATARRWSLVLLALSLLACLFWAKAHAQRPAGSSPSSNSTSNAGSADTNLLVVEEVSEKTPPRSATDSTLDPNSRRAGSLKPGKEARFSYWAQDQEDVGLLVYPPTLQLQIRPGRSWKRVSDEEVPGSLLRRITFMETGRYELTLRNTGSNELKYSLLLISLNVDDLQRIEYGPALRGQVETAGDVDVYAIDVGDSAELGIVLQFMVSSPKGFALILSPNNGLKYFGMFGGGRSQRISLKTDRPETLLLAISTEQGGSRYRLLLDHKTLGVFRLPPAGESETREYLLRPGDERSIPLAHQGREGWQLQITKIGEPFQLKGELGPEPVKFVAEPTQTTIPNLQLIESEEVRLTLENLDSHLGKVQVALTAESRSWLDIPYFTLFLGCLIATIVFLPTRHSLAGPFNHLHFPSKHYQYCGIVGLTSFVSLAALLWLGTPFLDELQELSGFQLGYLAKASGFTGFFITLYWINALVKSRQEADKKKHS